MLNLDISYVLVIYKGCKYGCHHRVFHKNILLYFEFKFYGLCIIIFLLSVTRNNMRFYSMLHTYCICIYLH